MTSTEFFLYLIYGYAMLTMGIFAIRQKDVKLLNLYIIKSLKYLGYFGIFHGTSELITMIVKLEFYPGSYLYLSNVNQVLKAVSFTFLMYFGFDLLPLRDKLKKIVLKIPIMAFGIYLICFLYGYYHLLVSQFNLQTLAILFRLPSCALSGQSLYIIAGLSCIISALALYLNAWLIEKTKSVEISKRYKNLAWVFIVYGTFEGLLTSKADFFPANVINKELFVQYFAITPLVIKAFVGFIINYLLIKVIDTFSWEQEEKLSRLEKLRIASEERRKLGLEIHDSIIQELYAAGLKVEYLSKNKETGERSREVLEEVKSGLSNTIDKVRNFISYTSMDKIVLEDLKDNLVQLVQKYQSQTIKIDLQCKISPYTIGYLSPEKSTQIYYIIQEAVTNVIKHSGADHAHILLEGRYDFLYITVTDNGKGISDENIDSEKKFGVRSMKDRAERIGGLFVIERTKNGTCVELKIPWEEEVKSEIKDQSSDRG